MKKKKVTWLLLVMAEVYFRYKVDRYEGGHCQMQRHLKESTGPPPGPGLVREAVGRGREETGAVAKRTKKASAVKMAYSGKRAWGKGSPAQPMGWEEQGSGQACQPGGLEGCWGILVASVCFVMSMSNSWQTVWI